MMLGNLIGAVTKGVVLGAVVYGAKKLYEKRTYTPMKEPLEPSVQPYDSSTYTSASTSSMNESLQEDDLLDDDIDYKSSSSSTSTKP